MINGQITLKGVMKASMSFLLCPDSVIRREAASRADIRRKSLKPDRGFLVWALIYSNNHASGIRCQI